ncbi:beta strand repeat-containing protein [Pararhizobium gei]|uniref:beta strand repeat-containing protein n=1 Tax=Pararhizobium gei TaxID=1395951 RepID=UPI0023DAB9F3|nr:calcium-binding protein [Rhizobium gei]
MPATPVTWLEEFIVNSNTDGSQFDPNIVQLANGNILVSWTSSSDIGVGAPAGNDIIGRIYDPLGNAIGGEFLVNGDGSETEQDVDMAALPNGGFLAAYERITSSGFTDIVLTEFTPNGTVEATVNVFFDSNVNAAPAAFDPVVAVSSATSALILWQETIDATTSRVMGRIYDSTTNTFTSAAFSVITGGQNFAPDITVLSNGNYAIAEAHTNGGASEIFLRILDATGANVKGATLIASTGGGDTDGDLNPSITALTGGGFVVAWENSDSDTDIEAQIFDANGTLVGGIVNIETGGSTDSDNEPVVVALADGGFAVVYDDDEVGALKIERHSSTGALVGDVFTIATGFSITNPTATILADGRLAISFENDLGEIAMEILDFRDQPNNPGVYSPDQYQIGTIGDDVFTADNESEFVHGWTGNDIITENGQIRSYFGDEGNDTLIAVSPINSDVHDGGDGIDTIDWSQNFSLEDGVVFDLGLGTVSLNGSTEVMVGFEKIIGTGFADIIIGDGNANTLSGGGGVDSMTGGGGDDIYVVDVFNDQVFESVGGGTDRVVSLTSFGLAAGQEIEVLQLALSTGSTALNISGNEFANQLIGNAGKNTLKGGGANDEMRGAGGDDTYVVTETGDTVFESVAGGNDTIVSTVSFELGAGQEIEILRLAASTGTTALNLKGNQFDNELTGNAGSNVLTGNGGNDTMSGGGGDDTYVVSEAGDDVLEATGNGTDTVVSTVSYGLDVNQYVEVLRLAASTGNTALNLTGNNIGQQIIGNVGANTLNGGNGNDTLIGGDGDDVYYFNTTLSSINNVDTITGFAGAAGNNDTIALKNTIFSLLPAGALSAANFVANASGTAGDGNDFIVYNTTTGGLFYDTNGNGAGGATQFATLSGSPSLTSSDFLIV